MEDSSFTDLKTDLDICLRTFRSLDGFSVRSDTLYFKESTVSIITTEDLITNVKAAMHCIIQEKDKISGTLKRANDALQNLARREAPLTGLDSYGSPEVKPPPVDVGPLMNQLDDNQQQTSTDSDLAPRTNGRTKEENEGSIHEHALPEESQTSAPDDSPDRQPDLVTGTNQSTQTVEETGAEAMTQTQCQSDVIKSSDAEQMKRHIQELTKENSDLKEKQERDTRLVLMDALFRSVKGAPVELTQDVVVKQLMQRNAELVERLAAEIKARKTVTEPREECNGKAAGRLAEEVGALRTPALVGAKQVVADKVAEEYGALIANAWVGAKQVMDRHSPELQYEKIKNIFLTGVLKYAESKATDFYGDLVENMLATMQHPFKRKSPEAVVTKPKKRNSTRRTDEKERYPLPSCVLGGVNEFLQEGADHVDLKPLAQAVKNSMLEVYAKDKKKTEEIMAEPAMYAYIGHCARLAWKMAVQRPLLHFDFGDVGKKYDNTKLDLALGCQASKNATVKYYKYPSLFQGSTCLMKGIVYVD